MEFEAVSIYTPKDFFKSKWLKSVMDTQKRYTILFRIGKCYFKCGSWLK